MATVMTKTERAEIVALAEAAADLFVSDGWLLEDIGAPGCLPAAPRWVYDTKGGEALYVETARSWVAQAREGI